MRSGSKTGAVVLAAGKGTRMKSELPKVLHPLRGRPMILYVADVLESLGFGSADPAPVYVVGYRAQDVAQALGDRGTYVQQGEQLGTGHAAAVGLSALDSDVNRVLLIHGDEPLIEATTYRKMLLVQQTTNAAIVLLTGEVSETQALGRVVRGGSGQIQGLVQESELTESQRSIHEINFGAYVFDRDFMAETLPHLDKHPGGEYYLTDLVRVATEAGKTVESVSVPYPDEQMGINDAGQRERAEAFLAKLAGESRSQPVSS